MHIINGNNEVFEIMHSMHRLLLTNRTLYVVVTDIENCDISKYDYTPEEREFLVEQKRLLVDAYRENLMKVAKSNL